LLLSLVVALTELKGTATSFSPMPRNPPTPTTSAVILPSSVDQHVHDLADLILRRIVHVLLVPMGDRRALGRQARRGLGGRTRASAGCRPSGVLRGLRAGDRGHERKQDGSRCKSFHWAAPLVKNANSSRRET